MRSAGHFFEAFALVEREHVVRVTAAALEETVHFWEVSSVEEYGDFFVAGWFGREDRFASGFWWLLNRNMGFFLGNLMLMVDIAVCSFLVMVMMITIDFMTLAVGAQRKPNSHMLVNLDPNTTRESHVGELGTDF